MLIYFMHSCLYVGNKQNEQKSHTSPFLKEQLDIGNVSNSDHISPLPAPNSLIGVILNIFLSLLKFFLPTPAPDPST